MRNESLPGVRGEEQERRVSRCASILQGPTFQSKQSVRWTSGFLICYIVFFFNLLVFFLVVLNTIVGTYSYRPKCWSIIGIFYPHMVDLGSELAEERRMVKFLPVLSHILTMYNLLSKTLYVSRHKITKEENIFFWTQTYESPVSANKTTFSSLRGSGSLNNRFSFKDKLYTLSKHFCRSFVIFEPDYFLENAYFFFFLPLLKMEMTIHPSSQS